MKNGYVFGTIPANIPDWHGITIGFIAHMDVVDEVPFENIRPRVITCYDGDEIVLNKALGIVMSPADYPSLKNKVGKTLVVTDGTTLFRRGRQGWRRGNSHNGRDSARRSLDPSRRHQDRLYA